MAQSVKLKKIYQGHPVGAVIVVSNNEAHTLIESGIAMLPIKKKPMADTMMRPGRKKPLMTK